MAEGFDKLAVLRQLIAERDRLNRAIAALMESDPAAGTGQMLTTVRSHAYAMPGDPVLKIGDDGQIVLTKKRKGHRISDEAKKKIAERQRLRWARHRAEQKKKKATK